MLEYVAKFTELARFTDDYVATNMAKVQKFEDGLKLSIRCKIVGFLLQDMNLMIKTAMALEREVDDARGTFGMLVLKIRGGRANLLLLTQERNKGVLLYKGFKDKAAVVKARVDHPKVGDILGRLTN